MNISKEILNGNKVSLAKGITLLESSLESDIISAQKLIDECLPYSGNSIRVGITGVPGVGKSTFIEIFGKNLTEKGKKVAVLAIDPSSEKTHGSILGDKSRMNKLSKDKNAFIRPSPSSGNLGGVSSKTRDSIILCEAAGFDVILIETVGVGQSETTVSNICDFCLLLMLAGAGDELQGIKRGVMEVADMITITKADGDNLKKAKNAIQEYKMALHLFPASKNGWNPKVSMCSAFENNGIKEVWETINTYNEQMINNNYKIENRKKQDFYWINYIIKKELGHKKYLSLKSNGKIYELEKEINKGENFHELLRKFININ